MSDDQQQDIFSLLGLQLLPKDEKLQLLQKIETAAREQVINSIITKLDEEALAELEQLMKDEAGEEDVVLFLKQKIPTLEELIKDEIELFKNSLIEEVGSIRQELESAEAEVPEKEPLPTGKELKKELSQIEKELNTALKAGEFDKVHKLTQRSKQLKKALN